MTKEELTKKAEVMSKITHDLKVSLLTNTKAFFDKEDLEADEILILYSALKDLAVSLVKKSPGLMMLIEMTHESTLDLDKMN